MQKGRVLLIDDELSFIEAIIDYMALYGEYEFDYVLSPFEVLDKLNTIRYDVVVSDYSMPEMNGIELLKTIRQSFDTPFILFTGKDEANIIIEAINSGVDFYLQKGEDPGILFTKLNHMIQLSIEKKKAKEALVENEIKYRELFEQSSISIIIFDSEGILEDINSSALTLFGLKSIMDVKGFSLSLYYPDLLQQLKAGQIIKIKKNICLDDLKKYHIRSFSNKKNIFVDISIIPHITSCGNISNYYAQVIDLTNEHLIENTLLKTSEQLSLALDGSRIGLWDWYIQSGKIVINERWAEIVGYTLEELSPATIKTWEDLIHPEDLESTKKVIAEHQSKTETYYDFVLRMKHKNGSWIYAHTRGKVTEWDSMGNPVRMIGTHTDITAQKKTEDTLNRVRTILEAISYVATQLMISINEAVIHDVLARIGEAVQVSRSYISINESPIEKSILKTQEYVWTLENGSEKQFRLNPLFHNTDLKCERWTSVLKSGKIVSGNVGDLESDDQNILLKENLKTIALIPIFSSETFFGVIGFDDSENEHDWSSEELEALKAAAGLLGASFGRYRADEELRISETNFSTFFNTIQDFLFVLNPEGIIKKVNDTVVKRLGYSEAELINQSVEMLNPESSIDEVLCKKHLQIDDETDCCVRTLITKERYQIPVETRVLTGYWNGFPSLFVISKDISALKLSEEKFSKAFQSSGSIMSISTLNEGIFIDVNKAFIETIGYTRQEIIGKSSLDLGMFVDQDIRKEILQIIHEKGSVRNFRINIRTKDNRIVTGIFSADVILIHDTEALLVVFNDITEIIRLNDSLLTANNKLNLLSSITRHDILNQVQNLILLEGLFRRKIPSEIAVSSELERLRKLIDTIYRQIIFTRDYQDMGIKHPEWISVKDVILKEKNNKIFSDISLDIEIEDLEIYADPMFSKVCYNLLENAVRHGGYVSKMKISFYTSPENGVLTFEDNGCGISISEKENIFKRGYGKNTGFGLFLTKEILAITGMTIYETGSPDQGARFEIEIPLNGYRYNTK